MNEFEQMIKGKKVLIFGLGVQGGGSGDAAWLAQHGAEVMLSDSNLALVPAGQTKEQIDWAEIIIKNPGVKDDHDLILYAHSQNKPVLTSIAVFVKYAGIKTIGVTGTRGKSTTVALIRAVLEKAFPGQIIAGGNIAGTSGLALFDQLAGKRYAVLELSSFQLHNFHDLQVSPNLAVITNLYPDHLNRYRSMEDYAFDKQAICAYQTKTDFCLYNLDNSGAVSLAKHGHGQLVGYSASDGQSITTSLPGLHNRENIAATLAVAKVLGISEALVHDVIANFTGLSSRLETIRVVADVTYINDTTSTTPIAAIKALQSLTRPTIWITGGDTKNLPFNDLLTEIGENKYLKKLVILGSKNIPDYVSALQSLVGPKILGQVSSMSDAVSLAQSAAVAGDNILLSPGFASFDLFKNEFDRGAQFNAIVRELWPTIKKQ